MNTPRVGLHLSVLVVTEHNAFAEAVSGCLQDGKTRHVRLCLEKASEPRCLREIRPDVALVDQAASTPDGLPLYQLVRNVVPDCEVILITTMSQAAEAARLARLWEVFDYVLTDSVEDVNRVPLLVERATTRCMPNLAELRGQAKMEHRRVLESLRELRGILKSKVEGPVVELLHHYKMPEGPCMVERDAPQRFATEAYQHSVVDLICGRLKRLETLIELSADDEPMATDEWSRNQILVVDDEVVSLELAKFILEKNGFDVLAADSAATAKRLLENGEPALILMDVHLGDANGLRLIRTLREKRGCHEVPVIVVTADTMRQTVFEAISADIQGYLRKPYDSAVLVEKVKTVLADANTRRLATSAN